MGSMCRRSAAAAVIAVLTVLAGVIPGRPALAAEGGEGAWFGFTLQVEGGGFFLNPVIESATVSAVASGSPAAVAGIAVKDEILEADGKRLKGARARDFEPLLKKAVGQPLQLRLKRLGGDEYSVTLVGAPRPAKP